MDLVHHAGTDETRRRHASGRLGYAVSMNDHGVCPAMLSGAKA